ncbi:cell wall-binding repeat-containing protein [Ornithinibacillus salinisoli]|uniref:Cell wall-binding repeat-containing protein n=1 Tax=Ornithinibacillus salinisoli TaxID=1848459 RepID=A0ABW4VZK7_9BACI
MGECAISNNIYKQLIQKGYKVTRIVGNNRYDTSVQVAEQISSNNQIFLTTGADSPDPLSIAPYAGKMQIPILLSNNSELPSEVL